MGRTIRRRNPIKKNKTVKGGEVENTKLHVEVRKQLVHSPNEPPNLFYRWFLERPAFYPNNLFGYANIQRKAVDEALSWLHLEDVPERDIDGEVIKRTDTKVYEDTLEFGNTIGKVEINKVEAEQQKHKPRKK